MSIVIINFNAVETLEIREIFQKDCLGCLFQYVRKFSLTRNMGFLHGNDRVTDGEILRKIRLLLNAFLR